MTWLAQTLGAVLTAASLAFAVSALVAGARGVRLGGARLLWRGIEWFVPSDRVPVEARPHLRAAILRWLGAMGCLALAGGAFALAKSMA